MPSPLASQRAIALPSAPSLSGVPVPLRAAFELMIAHDSRPDPKVLRDKSVTLLRAARDLLASPDGKFAKGVLEHYLNIYFPSESENKLLTQMKLRELPPLPTEIPKGFKQQLSYRRTGDSIRYYESTFGLLPQDVLGVRAFQRDYLPYLDGIIATVERAEQVPDSARETIDKLSAFIMGFCSKQTALQEKPKHASSADLAHLLLHSQPVDLLTLKIAASNLTTRDSIKSLATAIEPLVRRARELGVAISPEMERELTTWATRNEPMQLSTLTQEERDTRLRSLRLATTQLLAGDRGSALEVEWMKKLQDAQRDFEYRFDRADKVPANSDHIPEYPEVNYRFSRALRLTMPELNDLKRASELLERQELTGLRVEMDQSPFLWPRIAELILFSKPSEIILHSPTALEPFEAPTEKSVKPFLCQRTMHVIPVTLTTSPKEIIEQEAYLASKGIIEWSSGSQGEATLENRNVRIRIEPTPRVTDTVRALAPHIQPDSNCFVIRDPKASPSTPPLAFGVFFSGRSPIIVGHTTHTFGKTVCLFIAQKVKEAQSEPIAETEASPTPAAVEPSQPPLPPSPAGDSIEPAPPQTPITPEQPIAPAQKPEVVLPKKVKKAPPPPPVKEPRPRISDEHALVSRQVVAAIPEIQAAARSSRALKPEVPFTNPEMVTALHILKNGEKPGNKKLKALRDYVANDSNFRDALTSARLKTCREELGKLLDSLIS